MCPKIIDISKPLIENKKHIISPFCGSSVVELNLASRFPRSTVTCYDTNPHIINFHTQAHKYPKMLRAKISHLLGMKPTREFYGKLFERMKGRTIQDAADWWMCTKMSFNGKITRSSFTVKKMPKVVDLPTYPSNITFIHGDAMEAMEKIPKARWKSIFLYLDPPYAQKSAKAYIYGNKSADRKDDFDHKRLAALLKKITGFGATWVLSYGRDPLINKLYKGFRFTRTKTSTVSWSVRESKSKIVNMNEILITSETPRRSTKRN
jgi:site-specific DNA-adenine methylase